MKDAESVKHWHEQSMLGPYCFSCGETLHAPYGYWPDGQPNAPQGWKEYTIVRKVINVVKFRAKDANHALSHSKNMMMVEGGHIDSQYIAEVKD